VIPVKIEIRHGRRRDKLHGIAHTPALAQADDPLPPPGQSLFQSPPERLYDRLGLIFHVI
jgi:hypothetical protein